MKDLLDKLNQENKVEQNKLKVEKNLFSIFNTLMEPYFNKDQEPNPNDFLRYAPEVHSYQINKFCNSVYSYYDNTNLMLFSLEEYISVVINKSKDSVVELNLCENIVWSNLGKWLESKRLIINGNLSRDIGWRMKNGEIVVNGNVGHHLGSRMSGGSITINGNATDYVGKKMFNGIITVNGDVCDHVGHSMNNGLIIINGNCGRMVGFGAKSGIIKVNGNYENIHIHDCHAAIYHKEILIAKDGEYL